MAGTLCSTGMAPMWTEYGMARAMRIKYYVSASPVLQSTTRTSLDIYPYVSIYVCLCVRVCHRAGAWPRRSHLVPNDHTPPPSPPSWPVPPASHMPWSRVPNPLRSRSQTKRQKKPNLRGPSSHGNHAPRSSTCTTAWSSWLPARRWHTVVAYLHPDSPDCPRPLTRACRDAVEHEASGGGLPHPADRGNAVAVFFTGPDSGDATGHGAHHSRPGGGRGECDAGAGRAGRSGTGRREGAERKRARHVSGMKKPAAGD